MKDKYTTIHICSNPDFWRGFKAGFEDGKQDAMENVFIFLLAVNCILWVWL